MPKFDHRFDNSIQRKEDLRFDLDDACEFADAQCRMYGEPQNVLKAEGDLYKVVEGSRRILNSIYFVSEVG